MWRVALRPKWIAGLAFALAVAAAFVLLSQWQLARSVEQGAADTRDTESVVSLDSVAEPQAGVTTDAASRRVSVSGHFVEADTGVLAGRLDGGTAGYWTVGHFVAANGASLAVAVGWSAERPAASTDLSSLTTLTGRFLPSEQPNDDPENGERRTMAVAALINEWSQAPDTVYGGYLVLADAPAPLATIDSPPPSKEVEFNLLNIFYAIEWVVFAGFAVFLWARFVRDEWERERDEAQLN